MATNIIGCNADNCEAPCGCTMGGLWEQTLLAATPTPTTPTLHGWVHHEWTVMTNVTGRDADAPQVHHAWTEMTNVTGRGTGAPRVHHVWTGMTNVTGRDTDAPPVHHAWTVPLW